MFLSFKVDLMSSPQGLKGEHHSDNPPFLYTITHTEFLLPRLSISRFHQDSLLFPSPTPELHPMSTLLSKFTMTFQTLAP